MENFLPALLIIGGVIYKIYSEFQKEQEKARRRIPQKQAPLPPTAREQPPGHTTTTEPVIATPIPKVISPRDTTSFFERVDKPQKKSDKKRLAVNQEKLTVTKTNEVEEKQEVVSFDLREAVIQSAILNRPY